MQPQQPQWRAFVIDIGSAVDYPRREPGRIWEVLGGFTRNLRLDPDNLREDRAYLTFISD